MGKVTIQRYTINNPISMMGEEAGICWNADTSDNEKNFKNSCGYNGRKIHRNRNSYKRCNYHRQ